MSEPTSHRKEPPEDSCAISTSIFQEFCDTEDGVPKDSEVFKERERISQENFLKRKAEKEQREQSEDE